MTDIHDPRAYINAIGYVCSFQSFDFFAKYRVIKNATIDPIKYII